MVASSSKQQITTLDDYVALVASCTGLPSVQEQLAPAVQRLANGKSSGKDKSQDKSIEELLVEPTSSGQDPLDVLQAPFGYGYLLLLHYRTRVPNVDVASLLARIAVFASNTKAEELLLIPQFVASLAEWTREESLKLGQIKAAVDPVGRLWAAVCPPLYRTRLTVMHKVLAYTCLQAQEYQHGAMLLQDRIIEVDTLITYHDHLLYHYYVGTIFAAVGQWELSIAALENVISAPGSATAAVQLDAYKKLVLVSYLGRGKAARVPKYTSSGVQNHFRNTYGEPYIALCDALLDNNIANATQAFNKHVEVFKNDGNLGLVERAIERLRPQIIHKLTETYVALSLAEIARHLELEEPESPAAQREVERLVRHMMDRREIHAEIQPDPSGVGATVAFLPDPEPYNTAEAAFLVDRMSQDAIGLGRYTRQRDMYQGFDKAFLQKAISQAGQAPSATAAFGGMLDEELDFGPGMMRRGDDAFFDE